MKEIVKSLLIGLMFVMGTPVTVFAQEQQPFEGEILMETYENYSDAFKKGAFAINFDGVHKLRLILKGNMMHVIDETTTCHIIINAELAERISKEGPTKHDKKAGGGYIHFCDLTKTGMDFTKQIGNSFHLVPWDFSVEGLSMAPLTKNTFAATETVKSVAGKECVLYEGDINHNLLQQMNANYHVSAYVSDIPAPKAYPWMFYGLLLPNIAMKCIIKYDGGHLSTMGVGEVSSYVEYDVTEIKPRAVSDDEFTVPSDYKIGKKPWGMVKYYRDMNNQLKKHGIKGGEKSEKTTGVHYKTDDSWDF